MVGRPIRPVPGEPEVRPAEAGLERLQEWARVSYARELERLLRRYAWTSRERALIRAYSRRLVRRVLVVVRAYARRPKPRTPESTESRSDGQGHSPRPVR